MANLKSYNFVKNEEEVLKYWNENQCFEKLREKNKNGKKYRFITFENLCFLWGNRSGTCQCSVISMGRCSRNIKIHRTFIKSCDKRTGKFPSE